MYKLLIIFCIVTGILYPQSFQLGLRSESTFENTTTGSEFIPFGHFYITSGITEKIVPVLNDLTEEIRLGGMIAPDNMEGFDFSLNLKTHVYKKYFYISGGIDFHHNAGSSHNTSVNYEKTLGLIVLGLGYSPDNIFYVELSQYIPISNASLGGSYYYSNNNYRIQQNNLNALTAIDFGINFNL